MNLLHSDECAPLSSFTPSLVSPSSCSFFLEGIILVSEDHLQSPHHYQYLLIPESKLPFLPVCKLKFFSCGSVKENKQINVSTSLILGVRVKLEICATFFPIPKIFAEMSENLNAWFRNLNVATFCLHGFLIQDNILELPAQCLSSANLKNLIFQVITATIGLVGNLASIFLLSMEEMKNCFNYLLISLAMFDMVFILLVTMDYSFVRGLDVTQISPTWKV